MRVDTLLIDVGSVTLNFAQSGTVQMDVAVGVDVDAEANMEMWLHKMPATMLQ